MNADEVKVEESEPEQALTELTDDELEHAAGGSPGPIVIN